MFSQKSSPCSYTSLNKALYWELLLKCLFIFVSYQLITSGIQSHAYVPYHQCTTLTIAAVRGALLYQHNVTWILDGFVQFHPLCLAPIHLVHLQVLLMTIAVLLPNHYWKKTESSRLIPPRLLGTMTFRNNPNHYFQDALVSQQFSEHLSYTIRSFYKYYLCN